MSMDAVTDEKLKAVYDNSEKAKALNTELESILYGADTGGKSWYDFFWDVFQANGTRASYYSAFYGSSWKDEIFKPKYDIKPTNAYGMFNNSGVTDLVETANKCGIIFDFSNNENFQGSFSHSHIQRLGVIDTTSSNAIYQTFYNAQEMHTIEKLIFKSDGSQTLTTPFRWNYALVNLSCEGAIGATISFADATKLSLESAISIITHLKDYSADTTNAYKYTLTFSSKTIALLEAAGNASPNGTTWLEYIDSLAWNCS